jgi:PIN domain nuclease of toxin-antitoxin system
MKLLLDTCALLWFLADDSMLSATAKIAIQDQKNERWVSPISLLEIAIKVRNGKLPLPAPFAAMFPSLLTMNHLEILPLAIDHIEALTTLPKYHRDPFDRLLAATSLVEKLTLVSSDTAFDMYGAARLW